MNTEQVQRLIEARSVRIPEAGCWIWMGSAQAGGYGDFRLAGVHYLAHRAAFAAFIGPIGGLHVLHRCDVPACVNPGHLFLGSNTDNIVDSMNKGRRTGISYRRPSGLKYRPIEPEAYEGRRKAKLADRKAIVDRVARGETQRSVAIAFGISSPTVSRLVAMSKGGDR